MLVLSRKVGEKIVIAGNIIVTVSRLGHSRVVLGIEAPPEVRVVRGELKQFDDEFRPPATPAADASIAPLGPTVCETPQPR